MSVWWSSEGSASDTWRTARLGRPSRSRGKRVFASSRPLTIPVRISRSSQESFGAPGPPMALGWDDACCATARGDDGLTPVPPPYLVSDAELAHCDLQDFPLTSWGANLGRVDDDDVARSRRHRARRCTPGGPRGTAGHLHRGFGRCPLTADLLRGARLGRGHVPSGLLGLRVLSCGLLPWHCSPPYRLLFLQPTSSTVRKAGGCPATRAVPADRPSCRSCTGLSALASKTRAPAAWTVCRRSLKPKAEGPRAIRTEQRSADRKARVGWLANEVVRTGGEIMTSQAHLRAQRGTLWPW